MIQDALGDRMKAYEDITNIKLTKRSAVIIRIDGRAFHTFTQKYFNKGYDSLFTNFMISIGRCLASEVQGCDFIYGQSDEISLLLTDYKTIRTQGWFDYELRKLISISASLASAEGTCLIQGFDLEDDHIRVIFDSRAFIIPQDEVCNYFIWRQQDATRNAIQMAGQEKFSQKQLHGKSCNTIQDMLFKEKGINFNDYPSLRKRGWCIINGQLDLEIPVFSQYRKYIENFVYVRED